MKTKELANVLGIADSTLRLYARAFEDYLSPKSATNRRTRVYSDHDVKVLSYVADQKRQGTAEDDIRASLDAMSDDELPEAPFNEAALEDEQKRQKLIVEIQTLRGRVQDLETRLESEQQRRQEVEEQLNAARLALAKTEGKLTVVESERRSVAFWLTVISVAVVFVVILAALVIWYTGAAT